MNKKILLIVFLTAIVSVLVTSTYFFFHPKEKVITNLKVIRKTIKFHRNITRDSSLPANNPPVVKAVDAYHMRPDDLVLGVKYKNITRAYPRWYLVSYHVVNDTINNQPLLVTQCEVCSAATAFLPVIKKNGLFSLSFVACDHLKGTFSICDVQTNTIWHPFTGLALHGQYEGIQLERVPAKMVKWKNWLRAHPDTEVVLSSTEQKNRWHGHTPESDINSTWLPPNMRKTANLKNDSFAQSELVYGFLSDHGKDTFVLSVKEINENSIKIFLYNNKKYFILRGNDYFYSAFSSENNEVDKLTISSNNPIKIKSNNGGIWDESGNYLEHSKIKENLVHHSGYLTEWWEWVSINENSHLLK
jgi:hypothetical protein